MEFKGTKGVWNIRGNKIFVDDSYISIATVHVQSNYEEITFKPKQDIEAEANAALIAKAPELLEMLIKLHTRIDWSFEAWGSNEGIELSNTLRELINK